MEPMPAKMKQNSQASPGIIISPRPSPWTPPRSSSFPSRERRHGRLQCHHPRRPQDDMEAAGGLKSSGGPNKIADYLPVGTRSGATTIQGPGAPNITPPGSSR